MTQEEKYKIYSNDFFDILIEYNLNPAILERYQEYTVQIVSDRIAVAYMPSTQVTSRIISTIGYMAIPLCYGLMDIRSLEASGVDKIRQAPAFNLQGQGVLVGILDTGIDYTNPIFMKEDGTSKIISIWDQTIESEDQYPEGVFYGTVYQSEQINQALQSGNSYEIVPSRDENGHGTMLAGIAAGSIDRDNRFSGVAPNSELVIVKLKEAKQSVRKFFEVPPEVTCFQENDIIQGLVYLVKIARQLQRPISICIGVGSSQGAHDGLGPLSSTLSFLADFPGVVINIAAGNEGNARRHYYGTINPSLGYEVVELHVGNDQGNFTMELWGDVPNTYSIDITSPSGEYIPRITEGLNVSRVLTFIFERTTINLDYKMVESRTGDQLILLRFQNPTPGVWRFQVFGRGDLTGIFHIWLPITGFVSDETYFLQSNPYTTVTTPGNSAMPITVTAFNPANSTLFQRASKGYTRSKFIKPELAAPGVNILCPNLEHGFTQASGTSIAAAHATGIAAMLLEWAIVKGNYPGIDSGDVKSFLIRGARRSANLRYPNQDWGYGIMDVFNAFSVLREDM